MEEDNQRDRKIGRRGKDKKERARYVRISWSSIFAKVRDKCSASLRILAGQEIGPHRQTAHKSPRSQRHYLPLRRGPKDGGIQAEVFLVPSDNYHSHSVVCMSLMHLDITRVPP